MSIVIFTGLDSIGPQKYAKLSGLAEWLNFNYPVNRRTLNIVLHDSSVVPADIVHRGIPWIKGTRTVGFFNPTTRPWEGYKGDYYHVACNRLPSGTVVWMEKDRKLKVVTNRGARSNDVVARRGHSSFARCRGVLSRRRRR